jgi:hypothetical protein
MRIQDRSTLGQTRRLQFLLLVLILWDVLAIAAELAFGSPLFEFEDGEIDGYFAARGSFGGAALVTLVMYVYALVRGPARYRGVLWAGVVEQAAIALFSVYHYAANQMTFKGMGLSLAISLALLVVLLVSMPREPRTSAP